MQSSKAEDCLGGLQVENGLLAEYMCRSNISRRGIVVCGLCGLYMFLVSYSIGISCD